MLGGETLTDFALALGVGILVGTYSSVFVATPLLVASEQRWGGRPRAASGYRRTTSAGSAGSPGSAGTGTPAAR